MNNIILDRIKRQTTPSKDIVDNPPRVEEEKFKPTPISPSDLKKMFMSDTNEIPETTDRTFDGIEEFVAWMYPNKDKFLDSQKEALNTLIQAAHVINVGCGCKRAIRRTKANEYFKTFWLNNQSTDLPKKVLEIGGFSSIKFAVDGGVFLQIS